jgi:hypothetical protein
MQFFFSDVHCASAVGCNFFKNSRNSNSIMSFCTYISTFSCALCTKCVHKCTMSLLCLVFHLWNYSKDFHEVLILRICTRSCQANLILLCICWIWDLLYMKLIQKFISPLPPQGMGHIKIFAQYTIWISLRSATFIWKFFLYQWIFNEIQGQKYFWLYKGNILLQFRYLLTSTSFWTYYCQKSAAQDR